MTSPIFPAVGPDGKIRENHLPTRLSDAEIAKALRQYRGTGFPNGKVSAPVGSIYTDTAATAGAIRWIKTSGTGATGWKVEYGDTGMRNISSLTTATQGNFTLQRTGQMVSINAPSILFDMSDGAKILTLPEGFRPPSYIYTTTPPYWSSDVNRTVRIETNGSVIVRGGNSEDILNISFLFQTNNPWPTTLPGIPS